MIFRCCAKKTRSGAVVANDTVIYTANTELPFGGVGESGMGSCHGRHSFVTFSHLKPVMKGSFKFDLSYRYPPYQGKIKILQRIIKVLSFFDGFFGKH